VHGRVPTYGGTCHQAPFQSGISKHKTSNGVGLFATILAWCLATEEQGQNSLHGHYLLYVENWNRVINIRQRRKNELCTVGSWTFAAATPDAKEMFVNACSVQLFPEFEAGKALSEVSVFLRPRCRSDCNPKEMQFTVKPVEDQILREMRHKAKCHILNGQIASCGRCSKIFGINKVVENALNVHLGKFGNQIRFPEGHFSKPLDRIVYEM
jgi:hypothetical protein